MTFNEKIRYLVNSKSNDFNHMVCMEELAELQKEVSKMYRGVGKLQDLREEIVDVYIVIKILMEIYNIDDENLGKELDKKMARNMERVKCS